MKAPDSLETERLVLRRAHPGDAPAIFERYASDPVVTGYVGWPRHRSIADTHAFLVFSESAWERWPGGPYLITSRENGMVWGGTGLMFETPYRASTGYILAKDAWGHGYATEALRAMVALSNMLTVRRLYALCHTDHPASARVLEKCGFEREGVLRQYLEFPNLADRGPHDVFCYARLF